MPALRSAVHRQRYFVFMSEFIEEQVEIAEVLPEASQPPVASEATSEDVLAEASVAENSFRTLGLNDSIVRAVENSGYHTPTPIQAVTIPLVLAGRDILGQAQTGTGKTAAFALPLLQMINVADRRPQVLVLTPTRELAIQVAEAFEKYAGEMRDLRVVPIYGGQDYQIQFRALDRRVYPSRGETPLNAHRPTSRDPASRPRTVSRHR